MSCSLDGLEAFCSAGKERGHFKEMVHQLAVGRGNRAGLFDCRLENEARKGKVRVCTALNARRRYLGHFL